MEQYEYTPTNTFQVKNNYIHRKVAGNDVLISIGENIANFNGYIQLNESAACLWELMKEPCTINNLSQTLVENFQISDKEARDDAIEFLRELQAHDMIVIGEE